MLRDAAAAKRRELKDLLLYKQSVARTTLVFLLIGVVGGALWLVGWTVL